MANPTSRDWIFPVYMDAASLGDGCGQSETLTFRLAHGPLRTSRAVRAVEIRRDIIC